MTTADAKDSTNIHLRDGDVVLYRRGQIKNWQARYKVADGWKRISTKTAKVDRAKSIATEAYDRSRFLQKEGLPDVSKRFDSVAKVAISEMEKALETGTGKKTYTSYIQAINKHLIPFFGRKYIDKIGHEELEAFALEREKLAGKVPAASTITNHNSALNRVFDVAVSRGWVHRHKIPELKNSGRKSNRRPDFSYDEWRTIQLRFPHFVKQARTEKSRMMRQLLMDYANIVANTGLRHGTEAYGLKWKHIEWFKHQNGERYLRMTVIGKTGKRELIARNNCEGFLKRIQSRFEDLEKLTFDQLLDKKIDQMVFRLQDGTSTQNLNATFEQFLKKYKMLQDPHGQARTLYSLRHMYATLNLLENPEISIHQLAKQMGTSVSMIEKHYSHLKPSMIADKLAGKRYVPDAPKDQAPAKVKSKRRGKVDNT